ncbi:MAG TPA: hypothetical protein DHU79_07440 [Clostridiales bacterium]|nr:hypothetical protein [Clostridiales bacterium]
MWQNAIALLAAGDFCVAQFVGTGHFACVAGTACNCGSGNTGGCCDTSAAVNQIVDFTDEVW